MNALRAAGRVLAWPLRRILDPRFGDVNRRLTNIEATTGQLSREEGAATREHVAMAIHHAAETTRSRFAHVATIPQAVEELVSNYAEASGEALTVVGTQLRELSDGVRELGQDLYTRRVVDVLAGGIAGLDETTAHMLNVAEGHTGFAAERGLWLNPPVSLRYAAGSLELSSVNERIVEQMYAFRALHPLQPGARVLDVGSVESTIPLSLAAFGYEVTALDPRPYPFRHPSLTVVESRLEDWDPKGAVFDAVLCVSTVEHIGLGWYGEDRQDDGADRRALDRLRSLLRADDSLLVLTVPYGTAAVDEVERTYDDGGLSRLLEGWNVQDRAIVRQTDPQTWQRTDQPTENAVALIIATPAPSR